MTNGSIMRVGNYLLDTNIVIGLLASDQNIENEAEQAQTLFLCSTVWGELLFGAIGSQRVHENVEKLYRFNALFHMLDVTMETAQYYAEIKLELKLKGRPITENDIWIAATARQYDLQLATRDKHFHYIEGL